jgi:hypothetical protein
MPIANDVLWKDLETKGFVRVPGFLSQAEIDACRADFAEQPMDANIATTRFPKRLHAASTP